jgi:hypothetical protein
MRYEGCPDACPNIRLQQVEVFNGFGSQDDLETHSGQNIARTAAGQPRSPGAPLERGYRDARVVRYNGGVDTPERDGRP